MIFWLRGADMQEEEEIDYQCGQFCWIYSDSCISLPCPVLIGVLLEAVLMGSYLLRTLDRKLSCLLGHLL